MQKEIWKQVKGYEGIYEVSNLGRVKSLGGRKIKFGNRIRETKETILSPKTKSNGYLEVNLQHKSHYVHRIVAQAFLGDIEKGYNVNHKNGIKSDNTLENIEIVTFSENALHSYKVLGTQPKPPMGERSHYAKLNNEKVLEIRRLFSEGRKQQFIADLFGVSKSNIAKICQRVNWYHI